MSKITNQLMTVAAVGLAGFALFQYTKQPGGAIATSAGQRQRDQGLQQWMDSLFPPDWASRGSLDYAALNVAGQSAIASGLGLGPFPTWDASGMPGFRI